MNLKNRLLLVLLADIIAVSAVGCSTQDRKSEQYAFETSLESQQDDDRLHIGSTGKKEDVTVPPIINSDATIDSSYEQIIETQPALTPDDIVELKLNERLYDENIDYKLVIETYLNMDYDLRSSMKDDYLRAIYMLMLNSGITIQTYMKELHIMMIMQQIPMCVPEDIWYTSFGHLITLSNGYPSLFEMFIDFATYVHELGCEEEHTLNEYYAYTCKKLEEELKLELIKQ